jgi:hypothetical protein
VRAYLFDLFDHAQDYPLVQGCRKLIEISAPPNPRTLKRVLNLLGLLIALDGGRDIGWDSPELEARKPRALQLAKVVLMQVLFDEADTTVAIDAGNLVKLEQAAEEKTEEFKEQIDAAPALKALLREGPGFAETAPDQLAMLVAQRDRPERLADYAASFQARLLALTGPPQAVAAARASAFATPVPPETRARTI